MGHYRGLEVWKLAHELTIALYKDTAQFPSSELYGLVSQIRRCAASIGANLAEGCGRRGDGELGWFVRIASGSANELEYHLLLAHDLGFLPDDVFVGRARTIDKIGRMLNSLLGSIRSRDPRPATRDPKTSD